MPFSFLIHIFELFVAIFIVFFLLVAVVRRRLERQRRRYASGACATVFQTLLLQTHSCRVTLTIYFVKQTFEMDFCLRALNKMSFL